MDEMNVVHFEILIFSSGGIVHHSMVLDGLPKRDLVPNLFCLIGA